MENKLEKDSGYKETLLKLLESFGEATSKVSKCKKKSYNVFFPQIGEYYFESKKKILFIGRATNHWGNKWKPSFFCKEASIIYTSAKDNSKKNKGDKCPMDWINKKWEKWTLWRSPFLNVMYEIVDPQNINEDGWTYEIAWSNWYKIAPSSGGNPVSKTEYVPQDEYSKNLFLKELKILKPHYVIMIIGLSDWADHFFEKTELSMVEGKYVNAIVKLDGFKGKIIIVERPEGKGKNRKEFIKEVRTFLK